MPTFPNLAKLRGAIAETLWEQVSAHDLPHFCDALGMPKAPGDIRAWDSKRRYVRQRLMGLGAAELADVARAVAEQYDDPNLLGLISPAELRGVEGELKNLIFAVNGPKPRIVLRDAINNVIEIVENADFGLVYDRPLAGGLTWGELVEWWSEISPAAGSDAARALYARLRASVGSPAERLLFNAYGVLRPDRQGPDPGPGPADLSALRPVHHAGAGGAQRPGLAPPADGLSPVRRPPSGHRQCGQPAQPPDRIDQRQAQRDG